MAIKLTKSQLDNLGLTNEEKISSDVPASVSYAARSILATEGQYDLSLAALDERIASLRTSLSQVAFSGSYTNLTDTPVAASRTNDGFMTSTQYKLLHDTIQPDLAKVKTDIAGLSTIAKTGQLSDLPGRQIATLEADGLMSKEMFANLTQISDLGKNGFYEDLKFKNDNDFKQSLNTTTYLANNEKHGFMSKDDKARIESFFPLDQNGKHNFVHRTDAGFKHIPAGGSTNQILQWQENGTAQWVNNTTYSRGAGINLQGDQFSKSISVDFGTGHEQAARGTHNHDNRYLRIDTNDNVNIGNIVNVSGQISLNNSVALLGKKTDGNPVQLVKVTENNNIDVGNVGVRLALLSDTEPTWWDGSASHAIWTRKNLGLVTHQYNGIMHAGDKVKIDNLHSVASSGNYSELNGTPHLHAVATSGDYRQLSHTPTYHRVASTGNYNDLDGRPDHIYRSTRTDQILISGSYYTVAHTGNVLGFWRA